jgi:hypothetical protein
MNNDSQFWLGVFLSVPIGIATGVVSPWVQRWLEEKRALKRTRRVQAEYEAVVFYKRHPEEFTQFLVHVAVKTTFIGAMLGVVAGLVFTAASLLDNARLWPFWPDRSLQAFLYGTGQFATVVSSVMIVNICRSGLWMWTRAGISKSMSAWSWLQPVCPPHIVIVSSRLTSRRTTR